MDRRPRSYASSSVKSYLTKQMVVDSRIPTRRALSRNSELFFERFPGKDGRSNIGQGCQTYDEIKIGNIISSNENKKILCIKKK